MTGLEKIEKIIELIESGKTVSFTTYLKTMPVNLRTLNNFRNAGYELFKSKGNSIYMMKGKKYDCIDGCKITYV